LENIFSNGFTTLYRMIKTTLYEVVFYFQINFDDSFLGSSLKKYFIRQSPHAKQKR